MIEIQNLSGNLGGFRMQDINLTVNDGEYMVLLGPTGAGKTVLIEYIVGMYKQDRGAIRIDDQDITGLYTEERNIAYVPQDYALFPNLNVEKNIAYGLEARRLPKEEIARITDEVIANLGIGYIRGRMPLNLSGGEKQRVALGRALATGPKMVLLDEPLSALDENLRAVMSRELRALQQKTGATFVHVCHNFEEASAVADRIAIMNDGALVQIGTLEEIKAKPQNEFVARFLKTQNVFEAISDGNTVKGNGIVLEKSSSLTGTVVAGIRPEYVRLLPQGQTQAPNTFAGRILDTVPKPHFMEYGVDVGMHLTSFHIGDTHYRPGEAVSVQLPAEHLILTSKN